MEPVTGAARAHNDQCFIFVFSQHWPIRRTLKALGQASVSPDSQRSRPSVSLQAPGSRGRRLIPQNSYPRVPGSLPYESLANARPRRLPLGNRLGYRFTSRPTVKFRAGLGMPYPPQALPASLCMSVLLSHCPAAPCSGF